MNTQLRTAFETVFDAAVAARGQTIQTFTIGGFRYKIVCEPVDVTDVGKEMRVRIVRKPL